MSHQPHNQTRPSIGAFVDGDRSTQVPPAAPLRPPQKPQEGKVTEPLVPEGAPKQDTWYYVKYYLNPTFRKEEDGRIAEEARQAEERQQAEAARREALRVQRHEDILEYRRLLIEKLKLAAQRRSFTTTVSHVKGGVGKTTTTCYFGSTLGYRTTRITTIIDNNEDWGTTGRLLGISRDETLTVRTAHARKDELTGFRSFSGQLGSTKHSVQLVTSDALTERSDHYDYDTASEVIEIAQENSIFVVNDTGNHISGEAMRAILDKTRVLIVPTITTGSSLEGATVTMENYRDWGYSELVDHAIVVVSGLHPGEIAENYRERLQLSDKQILIGTPYDQRIHDDVVIDLDQTPLLTQIAYLELALVTVLVEKHVDLNSYKSEPLKVTQGQLVALPSGRLPQLPYIVNTLPQTDADRSNGIFYNEPTPVAQKGSAS